MHVEWWWEVGSGKLRLAVCECGVSGCESRRQGWGRSFIGLGEVSDRCVDVWGRWTVCLCVCVCSWLVTALFDNSDYTAAKRILRVERREIDRYFQYVCIRPFARRWSCPGGREGYAVIRGGRARISIRKWENVAVNSVSGRTRDVLVIESARTENHHATIIRDIVQLPLSHTRIHGSLPTSNASVDTQTGYSTDVLNEFHTSPHSYARPFYEARSTLSTVGERDGIESCGIDYNNALQYQSGTGTVQNITIGSINRSRTSYFWESVRRHQYNQHYEAWYCEVLYRAMRFQSLYWVWVSLCCVCVRAHSMPIRCAETSSKHCRVVYTKGQYWTVIPPTGYGASANGWGTTILPDLNILPRSMSTPNSPITDCSIAPSLHRSIIHHILCSTLLRVHPGSRTHCGMNQGISGSAMLVHRARTISNRTALESIAIIPFSHHTHRSCTYCSSI